MPFLSPGDLHHPGIKPAFLVSLALAGGFFITEPLGKPVYTHTHTHTHTYIKTGNLIKWYKIKEKCISMKQIEVDIPSALFNLFRDNLKKK